MSEIIKYRKGKISHRQHDGRIWIADKELAQTEFSAGADYQFFVNEQKNRIEIKRGGPRKVAHRKVNENQSTPIIDIKNLRVKNALEGCDYITVSIYQDRIIVRGRKNTATSKIEEFEKSREAKKITSFSFFEDDQEAVAAGFISKGTLWEEEGENIKYSVPLAEFEAEVLPRSDVWFVNLDRKANDKVRNHWMHIVRLFCQVPTEKQPYAIAVKTDSSHDITPLSAFLQSNGYMEAQRKKEWIYTTFEGFSWQTSEDAKKKLLQFLTAQFKKQEKKIPFSLVSFYCGCLSDLAFLEKGFNILKAYDLSKKIARDIKLDNFSAPEGSYRNNIGDHFAPVDIASLDLKDIPDAEAYFFSPPCHGFTHENGRTRYLDNPKNRHMWKAVEILKNKRPPVFAMEQVPDILEIGGGIFLKELEEELGTIYHISYQVIDAADAGSPQHRKRVIFLGSRYEDISLNIKKREKYQTVQEAFQGITKDTFNQEDITINRADTVAKMKQVKPGGNWQDIPQEMRSKAMGKSTHSNVYRRLQWDAPSCTITNYRKTLLTHPKENRGLSVREAARLMDVPDLYEFIGTLSEMQQQVGNGIALNIVRMVAETLYQHLFNHVNAKLDQNVVRIAKEQQLLLEFEQIS